MHLQSIPSFWYDEILAHRLGTHSSEMTYSRTKLSSFKRLSVVIRVLDYLMKTLKKIMALQWILNLRWHRCGLVSCYRGGHDAWNSMHDQQWQGSVLVYMLYSVVTRYSTLIECCHWIFKSTHAPRVLNNSFNYMSKMLLGINTNL